jgi:hypothetical protein
MERSEVCNSNPFDFRLGLNVLLSVETTVAPPSMLNCDKFSTFRSMAVREHRVFDLRQANGLE